MSNATYSNSSSPWWEQLGDTLGIPGIASLGAGAARLAPGILSKIGGYGAAAAGGLAAAPLTGALTAASVMSPTPANGGEAPMYIPDGKGGWMPNPANPLATKQGAAVAQQPPAQGGGPYAGSPGPSPMQMAMTTPPPAPAAPPVGSPTNLAPPSPGPLAPPPSLGPQSTAWPANAGQGQQPLNGGVLQNFVNAMRGNNAAPQQPQQQPPQQGVLPKLWNDISGIAKLFGGSGGSFGSVSDNAIY